MEKDKVRDKIKKLLKISTENGATQDEAINALKIATKLMTQYQIEVNELNRSESDLKKVMFEPRRKLLSIQILTVKIAEHFDCFILSFKNNKKLCVVGFDVDVDVFLYIIEYVYDVLELEIKKHKKNLNSFKSDDISSKTKIKNFCEGFTGAIICNLEIEKSNQANEIKSQTGFDLVVQKKDDIQVKLKQEMPEIKNKTIKTNCNDDINFDHYSYLAGYTAGKDVELNRQIEVV